MTQNPSGRYEKSDAPLNIILVGLAGLAALMIFTAVAARVALRLISGSSRGPAPAVAALPPSPRLQTDGMADIRALREQETETLENYGWVDRAHGVVRIPIERAMELTAERGLPAQRTQK